MRSILLLGTITFLMGVLRIKFGTNYYLCASALWVIVLLMAILLNKNRNFASAMLIIIAIVETLCNI